MDRSPYPRRSCFVFPSSCWTASLLIALLLPLLFSGCGGCHSRTSPATAQYEIYALEHKSAAEVEQLLAEILPKLDSPVHLVADSQNNQLLLRGPEKAQQIVRQLIESFDRPTTVPSTASQPVIRAYPCPPEQLNATAERLRFRYAGQQVRISKDSQTAQLLVLASPEIHQDIGLQLGSDPYPQERQAEFSGRRLDGRGPDPDGQQTSLPGSDSAHRMFLKNTRVEHLESLLQELFSSRFKLLKGYRPDRPHYRLEGPEGKEIKLMFNRQGNDLEILDQPAESLREQFHQLVQAADSPRAVSGRRVRILPIREAGPDKVQQVVNAYRGEPLQGEAEKRTNPAKIGLANYQLQPEIQEPDDPPVLVDPLDVLDPEEPVIEPERMPRLPDFEERLRRLAPDLEIEILPDLDVVILRGRPRDVEEMRRIIEQLEQIAAETVPAIDVYHLHHVGSEALAEMIEEIQEDLVGLRHGRVNVTPLVKPNALLLIGWGEAVEAVKDLIRTLDRPVAPQTQLRVFPLQDAPVETIRATVEEFFEDREGLGARVLVAIDVRTNSLVVQAAPRDMVEVELLLENLDAPRGKAVHRAELFRLNNTLAEDLAETLQSAIDGARGPDEDQKSAALELMTIDLEGRRLIESGVLNDVQITPDPRTNTLVVSAPAESMDLLAALIGKLDSPTTVAQIKVFQLVHGDATSLVEMLSALLPAEAPVVTGIQLAVAEEEPAMAPLRFAVDVRTNSIIASGSEGDLMIIEALLLRLDEEEIAQRETTVYRLRNAPALDVAVAITEFVTSEREVLLIAPEVVTPADQIEREVVVVPEPVSNALIISATPRFFDDVLELVEQLDAEPPQVMIQVLIAEVFLDEADEFGVELGLQDSVLFDRSLLGDLVTTTRTVQESTPAGIVTSTEEIVIGASNMPGFRFNTFPLTLGNSGSDRALATSSQVGTQGLSHFAVGRVNEDLGFGGLVLSASSESVSLLIRALQESRRVEVLSRPQITTMDNQPAFIQVGSRVPRIVGTAVTAFGQQNQIVLENVGLILGVTPRVSPEGMVVMEIDAEKSALGAIERGVPVAFGPDGAPVLSPPIDTTTAQTTVSALDGETVVLGGLITKDTDELQRRVPWLADIPILGSLFRYDRVMVARSELLIIMTPHVIRSAADRERLKQIEAARMNWSIADVHKLHGDTGLCQYADCIICAAETPVIYPDFNPRGYLPQEVTSPQEVAPLPELIGPGLEILPDDPLPAPQPTPYDQSFISPEMRIGTLHQLPGEPVVHHQFDPREQTVRQAEYLHMQHPKSDPNLAYPPHHESTGQPSAFGR